MTMVPFAFTHVTDLLESLESLHTKTPPLPAKTLTQKIHTRINSWFDFHHPILHNHPATLSALFSLLLPHLRPDRSYALREAALSKIIIRSQLLGSRADVLKNWRESKVDGDFATVVMRVMAQAENPPDEAITVEYLDTVLNQVAAKSRFSSDGLRRGVEDAAAAAEGSTGTRADILEALYRRLTSVQAKWVTRVVLKCLAPVEMPESHTLSSYHFLLPHLFKFQQDLYKACALICAPEYRIHERFPPLGERERILRTLAEQTLKPELGVKVGRPEFVKARSCKHAVALAAGRKFSMERKYDGEYIQIHIDTTSPDPATWLTLFSKSGRNSTDDRIRVHDTILTTLNLTTTRPFTTAILEGELLAYSTSTHTILPFHHLRSHVNRAGSYILAPPRVPNSQLMIVLFDALLLDGVSLLHQPYHIRLSYLTRLLPHPVPGQLELAERTIIDFGASGALETLRGTFARGVVKRWEGFVLKPWEGVYVPLGGGGGGRGDRNGRSYGHVGGSEAWIKLKKDYMVGCGDTGDFAVVGAGGEAQRGWKLGVGAKALTVFYVGCLMNKEEVQKSGAKPMFKLVFEVCYGVPKHDLEEINRLAPFKTVPYDPTAPNLPFTLDPLPSLPTPTHLFSTPLVFELTGGGFEKHTMTPYYVLRHPRVCKVYFDRHYIDALTLSELQDAAHAARSLSSEEREEAEEEQRWVLRLLDGEDAGRGMKRAWSDVGAAEKGVAGLRRAVAEGALGTEEGRKRGRLEKSEDVGDMDAAITAGQGSERKTGEPATLPSPPLEEPVEGNDQKCKNLETADLGANVAATAAFQAPENKPAELVKEGNDQKCRILETADHPRAEAETQRTQKQKSKPAGETTPAVAVSPRRGSVPPAVLREISPLVNAGAGRRRSSSGGNKLAIDTTEEGLELEDPNKGTNSPRNTFRNLPSVVESGNGQRPKIAALKSTTSQLIKQQLMHELQNACRLPPPIPSCATTPPESTNEAPLELKNGHSRISPLLNATVLLPSYLMKFPELLAKVAAHRPAVVHALPAEAADVGPLVPASRRCVVLVESNKTSLTKRTLRGLKAAVDGSVEGGMGFEVYDWRVAGKTQPEGRWEVDWSLFHVWSVV